METTWHRFMASDREKSVDHRKDASCIPSARRSHKKEHRLVYLPCHAARQPERQIL